MGEWRLPATIRESGANIANCWVKMLPSMWSILCRHLPSPFSGRRRPATEIFAIGFRNPWRFSFIGSPANAMPATYGQSADEIDSGQLRQLR